jgi:probable HAF family extracellular repeat protein
LASNAGAGRCIIQVPFILLAAFPRSGYVAKYNPYTGSVNSIDAPVVVQSFSIATGNFINYPLQIIAKIVCAQSGYVSTLRHSPHTLFLRIAVMGCFTCTFVALASSAPTYNIVALNVLPGGQDAFATGINERGIVVGHSTLDRSGNVGRSRPVMWDADGNPTALWPDMGSDSTGAIPSGINNSGQIVGRYGRGSGVPVLSTDIPAGRAFIWDQSNGFNDLGSLGGNRIEAVAINEAGVVTGSSSLEGGGTEPFIWDETNGMRGLGSLGGIVGLGAAINNAGQVAGTSWLKDFSERPFFWDEVSGMRDLGSATGATTRAFAMNDASEIVGIDWGLSAMAVWDNGVLSFVHHPTGATPFATDINNKGQIVGGVSLPNDVAISAFVWSPSTGFLQLESLLPNDTNWDLEMATAINDRGQIVGYGRHNGEVRGFLMTIVPEPTTHVLFVVASLFAFFLSNRFSSC